MNSSVHIDNKGKDIFILGKGPTQGLHDTMLTAKTQYSINFTRPNIKFCLSLHYNGSSSKRLLSKKISLVFREYFRRFFS